MVIFQKQNLKITGNSLKDISDYHSDLESLDCVQKILDSITKRLIAKLKEIPKEESLFVATRLNKGIWLFSFANHFNKNNPYYAVYDLLEKTLNTKIDIRTISTLLNSDTEYILYQDISTNAFNKPGFEIFSEQMQKYADEYDLGMEMNK